MLIVWWKMVSAVALLFCLVGAGEVAGELGLRLPSRRRKEEQEKTTFRRFCYFLGAYNKELYRVGSFILKRFDFSIHILLCSTKLQTRT